MVIDISDNNSYIVADILLQDIDIEFEKPKNKMTFLKLTNVSFPNGSEFKKWLKGKRYLYKIIEVLPNKIKVVLFNLSLYDEMELSQYAGRVNATGDVFKYIYLETAYKLEKCFE